jgi:DNA sulfur modification protein DndD
MIIKRLTLHNFGVYAGTNTFEFHAGKPIVLVGGLNGRGKTTFLEGVLLALYGKNSFAYSEDEEQTYGQYLKAHTNTSDGTLDTYVDLDFLMNSDGTEEYEIRREWNGGKIRTAEKVTVYKDGVENPFLTDNWAMFMENVLPSGLSSFFFFDGEKIADLAVERTSNQMKQSIKALLGITVLDHLESDINKVISRTAKNSVNQEEADELDKLREAKELAIDKLQKIDDNIQKINDDIISKQKKLDKANEEYVANGGDIVAQRQELIEKRTMLRAKIAGINDSLLNDSASELPLLLVKDLLHNIREKAEMEQNYKTVGIAVDKMLKALPEYAKTTSKRTKGIEEFLEYYRGKYIGKGIENEFGLSDTALSQLQLLLDQRLLDRKLDTKESQKNLTDAENETFLIDSYLLVDIDEKAIATLYKKIKKLEQEIAELESKLEIMQEKRKTANGIAMSSSAEFNKKVESYLKKVELNDDGDRIIKYANVANRIIDKYRIALQEKKVEDVAATMTKCYKQLANKKTLIERIEMDPVTLDMIYINSAGQSVPRKQLSAGEKQLMVIALLWSLAICSKKRLPVIIDTPLSRLDSVHRQAVLKVYFPKASDQTIILSTDSEIDRNYYGMMKKNIGDEFTLVYDEDTKSTTIKQGYFLEDNK